MEKLKVIHSLPLPENLYASWLEWANDGRLLAALYRPTTVGSSGRSYTIGGSRIISIPIKGGKWVALFADQKTFKRQNRHLTRITNLLRNDPEHIVMPANKGGDLDLWKVNVLTGHAARIAQGKSGTFFWYTNRSGVPILRYDCVGGRCLKINVFGYDEAQGQTADAKKAWKRIKTFRVKPDEEEDDYDFWPIAPAPETGQFYVMSNEDDAERRSIKIFDIKSQKYVKTVYEHPTVDVSGAVLDLQTGEYAGAWFYEDRLNFNFKDPAIQKHYKGLNTYFDNKENVDLLGFNSKGDMAVIYVTSPNNPGEYHVYDIANKRVMRLFGRREDMEERLPSTSEIIKIPTRDGHQLTAYWTYPAGKKMHKALKKSGVDVEFVKLEDIGHYNWDIESKILYLETINEFLSKHLAKE